VVGNAADNGLEIYKCWNSGVVEGKNAAGGIVARAAGEFEIVNCFNVGKISGKEYAGGIAGIAGVKAEMHLYSKGGHGYGMRERGNPTDCWPTIAEIWLASVVKDIE
jgi:hypothetical protein